MLSITHFDWRGGFAADNLSGRVNRPAASAIQLKKGDTLSNELRNFLALSYDELEDLNLEAKEQRKNRVPPENIREQRIRYLTDEKRIKAVTVLFSDLEGRLHMLDYDKKFLIKSWDNLTFDGSSIRGFTAQKESDLRLGVDWGAFYWAPADVFGSGKVLVFGHVIA